MDCQSQSLDFRLLGRSHKPGSPQLGSRCSGMTQRRGIGPMGPLLDMEQLHCCSRSSACTRPFAVGRCSRQPSSWTLGAPHPLGHTKNRGIATTVKSAAAEKLPFCAVINVYPVWIVVTFPTTSMLAVNGLTLPHVT